ncbi:hypothetical protein [Rhizobium sp. Root483D2]|uniref:hypothetical protein n=1 Tax=Rhizobium sp. Root483D2 TaxID=1736545 RepID=UPI0007149DEB|nr:hypothetical protein [Rhizobium sp. Root483D2]KQY39974.1 hypothetical protein ASD32_16340 [Rhizobium sp. Root483D2]
MRTERDVIQYIIVPPFEQRDKVIAAKERLEHYLCGRFPGNSFTVARFAPIGDDEEFCVLPIMNFVGDDGNSYMCKEPKRWFMKEIAQTCKDCQLSVSAA